MTNIRVSPEDTSKASRSLASLRRKHGAPRALDVAAAQIRADAAFLARWMGPSAAAEVLAGEAHRLVTEAAADIAAPGEENRQSAGSRRRRLLSVGRAAAWSIGILTGLALGLGLSALG